jgi:hypothetical protein
MRPAGAGPTECKANFAVTVRAITPIMRADPATSMSPNLITQDQLPLHALTERLTWWP